MANAPSSKSLRQTPTYTKAAKRLSKRYRHFEETIETFLEGLASVDDLGIPLGNGLYKARIPNRDKKSGKSGGFRLISYFKFQDDRLVLVYVYDKSDMGSVTEQEMDELVRDFLLE